MLGLCRSVMRQFLPFLRQHKMIRGWKNNPHWRAYYDGVAAQRRAQFIERMKSLTQKELLKIEEHIRFQAYNETDTLKKVQRWASRWCP